MRRLFSLLILLCVSPRVQAQAASASAAESASSDITVYRCVSGSVIALRDSPCRPGEAQQVRVMTKPKDAPVQDIEPIAAAPEPPREQTIERRPVQPMYECTNADTGATYTSDDDSGNAHWVDDYAIGIAPMFPSQHAVPTQATATPGKPIWQGHPEQGSIPVPAPGQPPAAAQPRGDSTVLFPVGGHIVRDPCHRLPQAETCARLYDRRYEILKSYGVVSHEKEDALGIEQRGIDARMANDCSNH